MYFPREDKISFCAEFFFLFKNRKMNKYGILTPIPAKMTIEPGQEGYIKRLESAYKSANFEKDGLPVLYDNNFERDVIGSWMVSTILKFKAADSVAYIELTEKFSHEEVGIVTHKNFAIILKIRARILIHLK